MTASIDAASAAQLELFLGHLQAGRKQQANAVMQEMLAANPGKAGAFALLVGGMLAQNGQYREAIPLYRESIALDPDDPSAYFYLGVAVHAIDDDAACESIWDRLVARFPDHALAHYQLALRQLKRHEHLAAKRSLLIAIDKLPPDHPLRSDAAKTIEAIDRELERHA